MTGYEYEEKCAKLLKAKGFTVVGEEIGAIYSPRKPRRDLRWRQKTET